MRLFAIKPRLANLSTRISNKFTLPERFKGTVVEKWAFYWKGLVTDYGEVGVNLVKDARAKPKKAAVYAAIAYTIYASAKRNPDEENFVQTIRSYNNNLILVPATLQNPESTGYMRTLEEAVNHNTLRLTSLGVCTLMWVDLHDKDVCTYAAICKYTGVGYWNFHERIIDVGFWNHWWRLDWKMRNFDVNYL